MNSKQKERKTENVN